MGDGFPAAVQPLSFVPVEGLELVATALAVTPGQTLVDLGCGRGGPGLWLAQRCAADLIGVDRSRVAVVDASQRRHLFPGVTAASFRVADVTSTGLPDASADAAVSIDVLQLVDDPLAMLREAARLLKPNGRIVLTTWEGWDAAPPRFPRNMATLLDEAGLVLDDITEQPEWLRRQYDIYKRAAAQDTGDDAAVADLAKEGHRKLSWHDCVRRILVTAHRGCSQASG